MTVELAVAASASAAASAAAAAAWTTSAVSAVALVLSEPVSSHMCLTHAARHILLKEPAFPAASSPAAQADLASPAAA